MNIKIALAGNPNAGKTTLFNALTGSNQFVGNWPGVTVEKKEGKLKTDKDVIVTDLPGVYSLSPYTLEEVVARNYLLDEKPDVILNIIDGTNLERNLYLTTQLLELGIPVVGAINMMDIVEKNGDKIYLDKLSKRLGCEFCEISALKETGIDEAAALAVKAAKEHKPAKIFHSFCGCVEHTLAHIEEAFLHEESSEFRQRWYAIKIFERDEKVLEQLKIPEKILSHIEKDILECEAEMDDDAESIITNERYNYIEKVIKDCCDKKPRRYTVSDKIDRVVTNKFLALPIFALVMALVYFVSITTVGGLLTDWANDGVFGDGWHLFGIGSGEYEDARDAYAAENVFTPEIKTLIKTARDAGLTGARELDSAMEDGSFSDFEEAYSSYGELLIEYGCDISAAGKALEDCPVSPEDYGVWVKGVPVIVGGWLDSANCPAWLESLILDGIIGGVGSVLGFVPQMLVLFIFLAFLEACGYMSRIAFVMDRLCRRFGLSGKSFIPMLIGSGCGVPGIMASRTIENERDRRMTITTTTFIPCGAKMPLIALIAAALFGGAWWVAPAAYFIGISAVVISGIILKKTKIFAGDPAPFVMELPAYHLPTFVNIMRSMWERGWSFIKKAGTIILLASIVIWAGSSFGYTENGFGFSTEMPLSDSILGKIGGAVCVIFAPLGFGNPTAAVASLMGLLAKEEIVGVFGVLEMAGMTALGGFSFLVFNLLCAPCFAAIGAIRREMNSAKWTLFAIGYQCGFAYCVSLMIYQFGCAFSGNLNVFGLIAALMIFAFMVYLLARPNKNAPARFKADTSCGDCSKCKKHCK